MSISAIKHYLQKYAEPECLYLNTFTSSEYTSVVVIPAYQETAEFLAQFGNTSDQTKLLLILVVNQPDSHIDASLQHQLAEHVSKACSIWREAHLSLHSLSHSCDILLVKRYQENLTIPNKYGVGLARKIGADLALQLINKKRIKSPWIAFTDADASLPGDYFARIGDQSQSTDVLTFDFKHVGNEDDVQEATRLYELGLKYYQAGLAWAGSRYAFHAVGSCLAINSNAYAQHRGMPKRAAGEDFYMLNKIAKQGVIKHLPDCTVTINSRISDRTPFGTGLAVNKIMANDAGTYHYYHPQTFASLKQLLRQLTTLPAGLSYQVWCQTLANDYVEFMMATGLEKYHKHHLKQGFDQAQLATDIHCWFDGLKTLQFIHYQRDNSIANIPIQDAITMAPFRVCAV